MLFVARLFLLTIISNTPFWCYSQTGPAGVATNDGTSTLMYWIDANTGRTGTTPVTGVQDLSGNNVINTIHGDPAFVPNVLNNFGVIRFNGNDDVATNFSINAMVYPNLTVFAAYVPRISTAGSVWGEDNGEWDRFLTDINLLPVLNSSVGSGYDPQSSMPPCNDCHHIDDLFNAGSATLSNVVYREEIFNGTTVRVNGFTASAFTSSVASYQTTGYSDFYVGAIGSNGYRFDGDIAEVIIFNTAISLTEQLIIENYLSAKYGIALANSSVDIYRGDNSGFDFDVAGIGMTGGIGHADSRGTGIVRMWSPSGLGNNEFLMWGHNNGVISATNTDVPGGVSARSNRVWFASEMDLSSGAVDVGNVNISFLLTGPVTASDLRLLVDTDTDGLFADESSIAGASFLGNDEYAFNNVSVISNGVRFTIATINSTQTPLPIKLSGFNAAVNEQENTVTLLWTTSFEKNNDRFEILRSVDAKDWRGIGVVKGAGNSSIVNHYNFIDHSPAGGQLYYRIRQVDFDGETSHSEVVSVRMNASRSLYIFPNPAQDNVVITGNESLLSPLSIYSFTGINFTDQVKVVRRNDGGVELDVRSLPDGDYLVVCPAGTGKVVKTRK
jgi:hypothetical protein